MKCPICARELPRADAKFCALCGKRIPRCPTCGEILYERSRFCEKDGTPLPEELFADFPSAEEKKEAQMAAEISAAVAHTLEEDSQPVPQPAARPAPVPQPAARPAPAPQPAAKPVPTQQPAVSSAPTPPPAQKPSAPAKKKKGNGGLIVAIVLVILLLMAAAGGGTYYLLQNGLPSFGGGTDASSSEDSDRDKSDKGDKEIEEALDTAEEYAEDGDYEKALETIQDALEEEPDSRKLKRAQEKYIEAFETETLSLAEDLANNAGYPTAIQTLQAALEKLGGESKRLSDKVEEYQALYQAQQAAPAPGVPAITMNGIIDVYATSYLSEPGVNLYHTPERTVDGDLTTAWVEGLDGPGVGESITFEFDGTYLVSGMRINAGYQKSDNLYSMNARPASLVATFSNGTQQTIYLQDTNGIQAISFSSPVETQRVTLAIGSVYSGTTYEDTVISELSFY